MELPTALPRLTGRWLAAYRVLWCVLALAGLFAATGGMWLSKVQTDRQSLAAYGVGLRFDRNGQLTLFGPLGEPAAEAGVVTGSELLAIDGEPASWGMSGIDAATRRLEGPEGSRVTVKQRTPEGDTRDAVMNRSAEHLRAADAIVPMPYAARSMFYWISSTLLSLLALATAGLLFWRRPSDPVAALFSVGLLTALVSFPVGAVAPPALVEPILEGLGFVINACLFMALLMFPNGRFDTRWSWIGTAILPVVLIWGLVRPDEAQRSAPETVVDGSFAGRTVLVVDDDARNLFALSGILELHGFRVLHAEDGRKGIERLVDHPEVALVLMDVMMPELDGYAATAEIRSMPQYADLPIIAVTAKAMPGDREKSLASGASDYVTKPVDSRELIACVRRWLPA